MQNKFWDAAKKSMFIHHRNFMTNVVNELNDDEESQVAFYKTLFEKMHLDLPNIKS